MPSVVASLYSSGTVKWHPTPDQINAIFAKAARGRLARADQINGIGPGRGPDKLHFCISLPELGGTR